MTMSWRNSWNFFLLLIGLKRLTGEPLPTPELCKGLLTKPKLNWRTGQAAQRRFLGPPASFLERTARNDRSRSPSWVPLRVLLSRLGGLLGRFGALLGRPAALLGASWAGLSDLWGSLRPSWSVGSPKRREREKTMKNHRKPVVWASWGSLGGALGASFGLLLAS